jgi:hypothetical protein
MQEISQEQMQNIEGGGWGAWAAVYVGVVGLACPPLGAACAIGAVALGAYDLICG